MDSSMRTSQVWHAIFLLLIQRALANGGWLIYHNTLGTAEAVLQANEMLFANRVQPSDIPNRLMIPLLYAFPFNVNEQRSALQCSLRCLDRHLHPGTPTDVFLFLLPEVHTNKASYPQWVKAANNTYPIAIPREVWRLPAHTRPERSNWTSWSLGFSHDYRKMGHFRLAFQFVFARDLGYKWLFQYDSDSYIWQPVQFNMVQRLVEKDYWMTMEKDYWMTNRNAFPHEVERYMVGLPELTRYWIVTRYGKNWKPPGDLFEHLNPKNLSGLYTGGWDAMYLVGNFNTFKLNFWFQEPVQDYVHVLLRSNGHVEQRWNELGPQSMMWQLFVPKDKFHVWEPNEIAIGHGRMTPGKPGKFKGTICQDITNDN